MELDGLLRQIDANREQIQARRPLRGMEIKELDAYYRIGTTYASNALEGNPLTLTETKILLEDGLTAGGKPIKAYYEATGHAKAYDFMLSIARHEELVFSADAICRIHGLFYGALDPDGAGVYRDHQVVITGTDYMPPPPADVPAQMEAFVANLNEKRDALHPVLLAAYAHRRLVDIHPFADGNGRTARLLMNLVLVRKGYCILSIPPILRQDYIGALIAAQRAANPTDVPFNTFIAQCELEAQRDYGRMFGIIFAH